MPKTSDPPVKSEDVYEAAYYFMLAMGRSPTFRELAASMGRSVCCVEHHMKSLREAGLVDWDERSSRSFRLTGYEFKLVKKEDG